MLKCVQKLTLVWEAHRVTAILEINQTRQINCENVCKARFQNSLRFSIENVNRSWTVMLLFSTNGRTQAKVSDYTCLFTQSTNHDKTGI